MSIQLWVVRLGNLPAATTPGGSTGHTGGDPSGAGTYTGRYAYSEEEGTVRMWDFSTTSEPGVPNYVEAEHLMPYGIGSTDTTFRILEADGHSLVLQSDYATLRLTRF